MTTDTDNLRIYLVGGAVRDSLLGLAVKDRDWVVVGATPEDMLARGFRQVGADFPVFLHPDTGEEFALARTERKQGRGYHGFAVYSAPDVTLEDDLRRRDLTINAMAQTADGTLIDPFHGQDDLRARRLRHVSPAFAEDPLRILRTARFAARLAPMGFTVSDETQALMADMVATGEVEHLVPERVWQEIQRALMEARPSVFFDVLAACGALAALLPELAAQPALDAAMGALRRASQSDAPLAVRFAALLAGVGEALAAGRAAALKAPAECQELARLAAHGVEWLTQDGERAGSAPSAEQALAWLDRADAWRRPERFERLLQSLGYALPQALAPTLETLRAAADNARAVSPKPLMAEGYKGPELGKAIRAARLRRIEEHLN